MNVFTGIIRSHCSPLEPHASDVEPRIVRLRRIRAVLFDIYGTLLISASGDVGTSAESGMVSAATAALKSVGVAADHAQPAVKVLLETIGSHHEARRAMGIEFPEIDIVQVWRDVIRRLDLEPRCLDDWQVKRLAVEYEVRINPVWPMPHLRPSLTALRNSGRVLGLISNAQFFTVELFKALLNESVDELGFDPQLQYYSYRHHHAKPGLTLYQLARQELVSRGIPPDEVLYVGNDLLNDVLPASQTGFRSALFAGDARSLRLRANDRRVDGISPDIVITDLAQIIEVFDDE